jgi:purine-cytosine permease-like protein
VANEKIWTGNIVEGYSKYTIWHVIAFSWLCNMPQHFGMGDLTILRYARKWQMGFCSSAGMYLGHYCAWVASGILCAAALMKGVQTDPGHIATLGAGLVGAFCVVVAGWNVASPTLYRAGLALQVATPNWSRWRVTLVVGVGMIICACIPAIIKNLDLLITTNALLLLPLGAFIFIDYRVFPKLGLQPNFAAKTGVTISWPAAVAWIGAMIFSVFNFGKEHIPYLRDHLAGRLPGFIANFTSDPIFLVLPEWFVAVVLYIVFSFIQQKNSRVAQPVNATH